MVKSYFSTPNNLERTIELLASVNQWHYNYLTIENRFNIRIFLTKEHYIQYENLNLFKLINALININEYYFEEIDKQNFFKSFLKLDKFTSSNVKEFNFDIKPHKINFIIESYIKTKRKNKNLEEKILTNNLRKPKTQKKYKELKNFYKNSEEAADEYNDIIQAMSENFHEPTDSDIEEYFINNTFQDVDFENSILNYLQEIGEMPQTSKQANEKGQGLNINFIKKQSNIFKKYYGLKKYKQYQKILKKIYEGFSSSE